MGDTWVSLCAAEWRGDNRQARFISMLYLSAGFAILLTIIFINRKHLYSSLQINRHLWTK